MEIEYNRFRLEVTKLYSVNERDNSDKLYLKNYIKKNKNIIFSEENISSHEILDIFAQKKSIDEFIRDLKEIEPDIRVIITTRNQRNAIVSCHNKMMRDCINNDFPPDHLLNFIKKHNIINKFNNTDIKFSPLFQTYDYFNTWSKLVNLLPGDNVCVLPFELLISDSAEYFRSLENFLPKDISINSGEEIHIPRENASMNFDKMTLNGIYNSLRFLKRGSFIPLTYSKDLKKIKELEIFEKYYAEGNTQLSEALGLPLDKLGYPVLNEIQKL